MNGHDDDQIQSGDAHEQQGVPSPPDPPTPLSGHQQQVPPMKESDFPSNQPTNQSQQPKPAQPQQPKPEEPQPYIPVR
jgi:hypothetical protein